MQETTTKPREAPCRSAQLGLPLLPANLPQINARQQSAVVTLMARMLLEAAGWAQKEEADDHHV